MIILVGNNYPKLHRYTQLFKDRQFHIVYNKSTLMQCISIEATEVAFIELPLWLENDDL